MLRPQTSGRVKGHALPSHPPKTLPDLLQGLPAARFFRGDRGKYKERGRKARMDSLEKTLEFVSQW